MTGTYTQWAAQTAAGAVGVASHGLSGPGVHAVAVAVGVRVGKRVAVAVGWRGVRVIVAVGVRVGVCVGVGVPGELYS